MMKVAGSFPLTRKTRLLMWGALGGGILIGLAAGLLFLTAAQWIGLYGATVAFGAAGAMAYFAVHILLFRPSSQWNIDNWMKGEQGEKRVGQAIEFAITARGCAVAHAVTKFAPGGDIDHIVATPRGIWVIETKYRKVPSNIFPKVLSRIASNTDAVRKWAPAGTRVRGCLVLAFEEKELGPSALAGQEKIAVYTEKTFGDFRRKLRKEARGKEVPDERIATDIWKLGLEDAE